MRCSALEPPAIKLLLVTIQIIDDIGAVAIIAAFYTDELVLEPIAAAVVILAIMIGLNRSGVRRLWPYLLGFAALWIAVFHSGVHATLAGVFAAFTVPLGQGEQRSPLKHLEHRLHPVVMFGIVPLFGFGSAGVAIPDGSAAFSQLPLAVALGLFIGKQIGVFGAIWLSDRTGLARKPAALSWGHVYAAALLCGIGFTMSLFIGELAFANAAMLDAAKIGTLLGSALATAAGYLLLRVMKPGVVSETDSDEAEEIFAENIADEPEVDGLR